MSTVLVFAHDSALKRGKASVRGRKQRTRKQKQPPRKFYHCITKTSILAALFGGKRRTQENRCTFGQVNAPKLYQGTDTPSDTMPSPPLTPALPPKPAPQRPPRPNTAQLEGLHNLLNQRVRPAPVAVRTENLVRPRLDTIPGSPVTPTMSSPTLVGSASSSFSQGQGGEPALRQARRDLAEKTRSNGKTNGPRPRVRERKFRNSFRNSMVSLEELVDSSVTSANTMAKSISSSSLTRAARRLSIGTAHVPSDAGSISSEYFKREHRRGSPVDSGHSKSTHKPAVATAPATARDDSKSFFPKMVISPSMANLSEKFRQHERTGVQWLRRRRSDASFGCVDGLKNKDKEAMVRQANEKPKEKMRILRRVKTFVSMGRKGDGHDE